MTLFLILYAFLATALLAGNYPLQFWSCALFIVVSFIYLTEFLIGKESKGKALILGFSMSAIVIPILSFWICEQLGLGKGLGISK